MKLIIFVRNHNSYSAKRGINKQTWIHRHFFKHFKHWNSEDLVQISKKFYYCFLLSYTSSFTEHYPNIDMAYPATLVVLRQCRNLHNITASQVFVHHFVHINTTRITQFACLWVFSCFVYNLFPFNIQSYEYIPHNFEYISLTSYICFLINSNVYLIQRKVPKVLVPLWEFWFLL